ncbi:hypothetical protein JVT61DRAFT_12296 [Boletus reticuloceps]|uniref:Uncharacterized protein n=1 Tax=Boletus reticuloceps TaxID=495285 RepID=A0A8I2YDY9_9AGAM|nr:hypothetical protein JVT61DRAFT_12296 [Boletus reticuloceps]
MGRGLFHLYHNGQPGRLLCRQRILYHQSIRHSFPPLFQPSLPNSPLGQVSTSGIREETYWSLALESIALIQRRLQSTTGLCMRSCIKNLLNG